MEPAMKAASAMDVELQSHRNVARAVAQNNHDVARPVEGRLEVLAGSGII